MFQREAKMSIARISVKLLFASLLPGLLGMCKASDGDQGDFLLLRACQFNADNNQIYNQTDLVRCLNEIAEGVLNLQGTSRSISRKTPIYSSNSEDYPIKNDKDLTQSFGYQLNPHNHALPSYGRPPAHYPTTGAGYLTPQQVSPGGSSFSLFNALTSISRYDDYKCIPRILCEVAAGMIPSSDVGYTRSTTSSLIQLGRTALAGLLNTFDTTGRFPLLNFAKAAILGYSNRGNANTCYREYSKCPRNPSDLVEYLNNHNGGFFRLFNGAHKIYKNFLDPLFLQQRDGSNIVFDKQQDPILSETYEKNRYIAFSNTNYVTEDTIVFFPNKNTNGEHETFKFPTENYESKDVLKRSPEQYRKVVFPKD